MISGVVPKNKVAMSRLGFSHKEDGSALTPASGVHCRAALPGGATMGCIPFTQTKGDVMSLSLLLLIVLILLLVGALPSWGYSRSWGYAPSGGLGLVLLIVLILMLMGRI
jgi:hypothetical protein